MEGKSLLRGPSKPLPNPVLLHEYFRNALASNRALAKAHGIKYKGNVMSYLEVSEKVQIASSRLQEKLGDRLHHGISKQPVVAVDIEPCGELIVVLLSVLNIGAVFLPIDSHSAINRVRNILNESQPVCIIVDSASVFRYDTETIWCQFCVLEMESLFEPATKEPDAGDPYHAICKSRQNRFSAMDQIERSSEGKSMACIIYTSGSSGKPKGVKLTHQAVINRLMWQWQTLAFAEHEKCCFKTSLLFVDSVVEIFAPLLKLIPLVVAPAGIALNPESFIELLQDHRISRLSTVPSLLRNLIFYMSVSQDGNCLPDLTMFISNSERLNPSLLLKFFEVFPEGKTLCNLYGSTETMADVTWETFESAEDVKNKCCEGYLSVGRPMQNSTILITDESLNVLPSGELGEICVTGDNLAEGYVEETRPSAFVVNCNVGDDSFPLLFRTGDYGRIHRGSIIVEGRRDSQIKIRGQRVNISEIERAVNNCPFVDKAVVLCHHFGEACDIIVAYYKLRTPRACSLNEITRKCEKDLPVYMRPKLLQVTDIPLQRHSGKIDRLALRGLYEKAFNRQSSDELAIVDEKEEKVLNILALNLNLPKQSISKTKSFFELGGNSVTMVSTIVHLKQHNLHIPWEIFSYSQSIQDILDVISVGLPTIDQIQYTSEYTVKPLHGVSNKQVIVDILAESFVKKEPLDVLLGVTKLEFLVFAKSLHQEALKGDLSFVVLDKQSGEIVGGDFLFNYSSGLNIEHHKSMAPILHLMKEFEGPIREKLLEEEHGDLIYNYCLCVHKDLPHSDQVKICHLIEGNVLRVAKQHGYKGVLTNNTNPVTQDICQHFFDYKVLSSYRVKDFLFNGHQVFGHAHEEYTIKMMIKYL